jgi:hypothetical protein
VNFFKTKENICPELINQFSLCFLIFSFAKKMSFRSSGFSIASAKIRKLEESSKKYQVKND